MTLKITKSLSIEKQNELLNFADHFADRLQDCLNEGKHPFGSGNAMSGVLGEFDDFCKHSVEPIQEDAEVSLRLVKTFQFELTCPYCSRDIIISERKDEEEYYLLYKGVVENKQAVEHKCSFCGKTSTITEFERSGY